MRQAAVRQGHTARRIEGESRCGADRAQHPSPPRCALAPARVPRRDPPPHSTLRGGRSVAVVAPPSLAAGRSGRRLRGSRPGGVTSRDEPAQSEAHARDEGGRSAQVGLGDLRIAGVAEELPLAHPLCVGECEEDVLALHRAAFPPQSIETGDLRDLATATPDSAERLVEVARTQPPLRDSRLGGAGDGESVAQSGRKRRRLHSVRMVRIPPSLSQVHGSVHESSTNPTCAGGSAPTPTRSIPRPRRRPRRSRARRRTRLPRRFVTPEPSASDGGAFCEEVPPSRTAVHGGESRRGNGDAPGRGRRGGGRGEAPAGRAPGREGSALRR